MSYGSSFFIMKDFKIRQKYPASVFSVILFPLFAIILFKLNIPSGFTIISLLFISIISIMSYLWVKPVQVFLDGGTMEDIDEIMGLTYKLPVLNTIAITLVLIFTLLIYIFSNKNIFPEKFLFIMAFLVMALSMIIYTYFITDYVMLQAREQLFTRRKTFPAIIGKHGENIWKKIFFTFFSLFFITSLATGLSLYIKNLEPDKTMALFHKDIFVIIFSSNLVFLVITVLLIKSITKPLNGIISAMDDLKEGNFDKGIPVISRDEIGMIANNLNLLSGNLFSYKTLLRQRIDRLKLLYNISQAANHIDNLDKFLSVILDAILDGLNSEKASVMLVDKDGEKLVTKAFKGIYRSDEPDGSYEFNLGEGIAGKVASEGTAVVANDGHKNPDFLVRNNSDSLIRNLMCVPMIIEERIIGVVNVSNKKNLGDYSSDDLDILTTLSAQIAGIIEKFRLREIELENIKKEKFTYMGRVAAGVAHEIKNPLNSIGMIIQRFKREFEPVTDKEEYLNLLKIVSDEVGRVNNIVERFLKFARPKKLEICRLNFTELIKELVIFTEAKAKEKNIIIEEELEENIFWHIDKMQMKQAVLNILLNAIEATKKEGKIEISLKQKANRIFLRIKDTGPGISEELQSKIFELYFTTKNSG